MVGIGRAKSLHVLTNFIFIGEVLNAALRSAVNFYCFIHKYKLSAPNFVTVQITFFIIIITKVHGSSKANKRCFSLLIGCRWMTLGYSAERVSIANAPLKSTVVAVISD